MKITDVKATTLKGYKQWNYVQIETDEGLTGLGEAHPGSGIADIVKQFRGTLVGKDPRNIEPLYNRMIGAARNRYAMGLAAIGGIETALWDLKGKILGVPVYQLLGGKYRDRIRLYADVGHGRGNTPEGWAKRAREGVADGYQARAADCRRGGAAPLVLPRLLVGEPLRSEPEKLCRGAFQPLDRLACQRALELHLS